MKSKQPATLSTSEVAKMIGKSDQWTRKLIAKHNIKTWTIHARLMVIPETEAKRLVRLLKQEAKTNAQT